MDPLRMSKRQAADALGVSVATFNKRVIPSLRALNQIPTRDVSRGKLFFTRAMLQTYLNHISAIQSSFLPPVRTPRTVPRPSREHVSPSTCPAGALLETNAERNAT